MAVEGGREERGRRASDYNDESALKQNLHRAGPVGARGELRGARRPRRGQAVHRAQPRPPPQAHLPPPPQGPPHAPQRRQLQDRAQDVPPEPRPRRLPAEPPLLALRSAEWLAAEGQAAADGPERAVAAGGGPDDRGGVAGAEGVDAADGRPGGGAAGAAGAREAAGERGVREEARTDAVHPRGSGQQGFHAVLPAAQGRARLLAPSLIPPFPASFYKQQPQGDRIELITMTLMNEDEGFAEDAPAEYAEYSYCPCPFRDTHRRPYLNPLRLKPPQKPAATAPLAYINGDLQELLLSKFTANHPSPLYRPTGLPIDSNFCFDSAFESGNLQYVVAMPRNVFKLYIKPDTNTMTHFQWFYFKVRNKRPATVTLIIKNFLKQKMSYRDGLAPFHRSLAKNHSHYEQIQGNVRFGPSEGEEGEISLFQLAFEFAFDCPNDEVEFCSQPPYSYARYCKIYKSLPFVRLQISRTVLGNKIEAFLLNENSSSNVIVVAMARQHPGESVGSWLMEGFVNRLVETQNSLSWVLLPMVNVDGVVLGNNRTGVQGYDFNRHWYIDEETNRYHLFPELKGIIAYFQRKRKEHSKKVKIFLDFHSHSSEQNVFAYGPPHYKGSEQYELCKVLPYLISKRNADFSLKQCSYHLQSYKKSCSRAVFLQKFGFSYSYTIESSFGLYRGRRVNEHEMLQVGQDVLDSVIEFATLLTQGKDKICASLKEILSSLREQTIDNVLKIGAYDSDSENQDESSPIRRKFEQKLVMMLTKEAEELEGSLFDRLAKKRENNTYVDKGHRQAKPNASTAVTRSTHKPRMRTEDSRKLSEAEEGHLPKVKWEREPRTRSSKKSMEPCDLDRLSLQEMKERLMKMKHSELGRRILIIDSRQST